MPKEVNSKSEQRRQATRAKAAVVVLASVYLHCPHCHCVMAEGILPRKVAGPEFRALPDTLTCTFCTKQFAKPADPFVKVGR